MVDFHLNSNAGKRCSTPSVAADSPISFHRLLPGYEPSELRTAAGLAERLGVGEIWVKEESNRFGLPAYKVLGASWAIYNQLLANTGVAATGRKLEALRAALSGQGFTLVTATDGNHGRAVARVARWFGLESEVFVPGEMAEVRTQALRAEGARVVVVRGSYDEAVRAAAASADERRLLIQDTSWPGYERVPAWIVEGYGTIFQEVETQLEELGSRAPNLIPVQVGVGSLAHAATSHFRRLDPGSRLVCVEPKGADCLLRSARAGRSVTVNGPHASCMAGLNCGTASAISLPTLLSGVDAFLAISDERAFEAMRLLASEGVVAGESGAAGLAGLLEIVETPELARALDVGRDSRVLVIVTEADTDPVAYERAVGRSSREVRR
ncbi:MAG: diaminopropionate ammonia-lyase [Trueperaceae bacterium]